MKEGWEYKKLGEVCTKGSSNISLNKIEENNGEYALFGASGYMKGIDFYHQDQSYIGVVKDGSGVGRVDIYPEKSSLVGTMQYIFPKAGCELGYLKYLLQGLHLEKYKTGAAIPHIYFRDYENCKVRVPKKEEQQKIVSELDLLSGVIEKQKAQLEELDKLAQSIFYDMFGDPVTNEKGWEVKKLCDIASFKNGINYHAGDKGDTIKFIGVGDFKNNNEIRCFEDVKTIQIEDIIDESYLLRDGDILIVRSNGSKDLVGRNMIVYTSGEEITYSGFCIRCRVDDNAIIPLFLNRILSDRNTMKILRQEGQGCNISNINQKILSSLSIVFPPLTLQQEFAAKVEAIEAMKAIVRQSLKEAETLFNERMDYYFN